MAKQSDAHSTCFLLAFVVQIVTGFWTSHRTGRLILFATASGSWLDSIRASRQNRAHDAYAVMNASGDAYDAAYSRGFTIPRQFGPRPAGVQLHWRKKDVFSIAVEPRSTDGFPVDC
jgi:hypothetical protein